MSVLWNGFLQGLSGVWSIAIVVIPLMIVLEIFQANGLLQRINRILAKPFQKLELSEEGAFPIVVAIFFGLTFGSGVILNHMQMGQVTKKEAQVIGTFIALAHALVEDTIIFMTLGAPLLLLVLPRLFLAYFVAFFVAKLVQRNHSQSTN